VTRIAAWVCFLSACCVVVPLHAADDAAALLKGIEQRYNHATTLQVQFSESYSVLGRARKGESGELTLRKPGRMRWDYSTPPGKLFVSDGRDVYLYTPETKRVEKTKLKASDDMRAPMAFLLGKLDFKKDFRDFQIQPQGANTLITARAKSNKLPYEKVQMLVTPDHEIHRLVIDGQDQSVLTFEFTGEKLNPPVDDDRFKFQMPEGATLVASEGGH
jgi:outer membrane lipoprotein carrier protein